MLEVTTKEINKFTITYYPMGAISAAKLDRKVMALLVPLLKGGTKFKSMEDIMGTDIAELTGVLSEALDALDDKALERIIVESIKGCTVVVPGIGAKQLDTMDDIDKSFQGNLETLYTAVFESWRFNQLTPFALLRRFGSKIPKTSTSDTTESAEKASGLKLER